jgi:hypothetical protein
MREQLAIVQFEIAHLPDSPVPCQGPGCRRDPRPTAPAPTPGTVIDAGKPTLSARGAFAKPGREQIAWVVERYAVCCDGYLAGVFRPPETSSVM